MFIHLFINIIILIKIYFSYFFDNYGITFEPRGYMSRQKKNPDFVNKQCPTCSSFYKISYRKKHQVYCSKSCAQRNVNTITKMVVSQKRASIEKYGVDHPMKNSSVVDNFKKSMIKKYGVDSALKLDEFIVKAENTRISRYGDAGYNNYEQIKKTCLERYGVEHVLKSKVVSDRVSSTKRNNHYEFLVEFCKGIDVQFLCNKSDYGGYHFSKIYKFKCLKCSKSFENTVYNLNNLYCDYCFPERSDSLENRVYDFLHSILEKEMVIKQNDRTVLVGKELDFYIPEKKVAIEVNGLYWHSEHSSGIGKYYHLNKTKSCMCHGVSLLHIFENEWIIKEDIIKSIIKTALNVNTCNKIYARNCEIREVGVIEKNKFLNTNHLQGEDRSSIKLGLYHMDILVSVMTFRRESRFEKNIQWELVRFCSKIDTVVIGGASRLFKYFLKKYNPKMVVTYSDRRFFSGEIYGLLGFKFVKNTSPGYHYVVNKYKDTKHRMGFQKHKLKDKLEGFDPNLTEWENMKNHGHDRIWDCGHSKWIYSTVK